MRAILFGSLGKGKTLIKNFLQSKDTQAMIEACRSFGAKINIISNGIEIMGLNGQIKKTSDVIHAGNSGIILRFCTAIGALASRPVVVTGDHSIKYNRPMHVILNGLKQLGVATTSMRGDGYAPILIRGPIKLNSASIKGEDSQFVSALLIAGAFAKIPIELNVENPGEKPWVALTLDWFDKLGINYHNDQYTHYRLDGMSSYEGFNYSVPGDFSSAAFPIAAALITQSELMVENLDMQDIQGDKALIFALKKMGASFDYDGKKHLLRINKTKSLMGAEIDVNDFIDALPILAVVACFAEGETHLRNASIAKTKECNRIQCMAKELKKMGADITETDDGLIIKKSKLQGALLHSHQDQRVAMALAVAGLGADGKTIIEDADCSSKTFPNFVKDFNAVGAQIVENP
jgi:3-phosphoshikimate 1-carboxyvinyltransferase